MSAGEDSGNFPTGEPPEFSLGTNPTIMSYSSLRPRTVDTFAGVHLLVLLVGALLLVTGARAADGKTTFDVAAGDASRTLKELAAQAGQQVIYPAAEVRGVRTRTVKGEYTLKEALETMLAGTGLTVAYDEGTSTFAVSKAGPNGDRVARDTATGGHPERQGRIEDGVVKLGTFEVMDSKLLNMDVKRSRDDAQPYVIFDHQKIRESGAMNVEDFLKQRLTMNTQASTGLQSPGGIDGNTSQINLRGLGTNQTLILIDGHRIPSSAKFGTPSQPDLNGIPLDAIERIEVLPTTASGIYGGGATGGVINVILRRDYAGAELKVTYGSTFDTDAALRAVEFSAGYNLEDGKTNLLLAGSFRTQHPVTAGDRQLVQRGRQRILANYPNFFLTAANPPVGATANIRSVSGANLQLKTGTVLASPFTSAPVGYAGAAADQGAALVSNAGRYNLDLADSAQAPGGGRAGLVSQPTVESLSLTLRRQFSSSVQAFLEAGLSNNSSEMAVNGVSSFTLAATAPNNPFTQAVRVTPAAGTADTVYRVNSFDRRIVGGIILQLPAGWKAEADYTWGYSGYYFRSGAVVTADGTTALSNGAVDILQNNVDYRPYLGPPNSEVQTLASTLNDVALRLAGAIGTLPAGSATLSTLLEYRDEAFADGFQLIPPSTRIYRPARSQSVASAYVEAGIPLFARGQHLPGIDSLQLQVAGRFDRYTVDGASPILVSAGGAPVPAATRNRQQLSSTDPTVGLSYRPRTDVLIRGSFGTGFVAPTVVQLTPAPAASNSTVIDPRRGNAVSPILASQAIIGGNPDLRPEKSRSWSAGLVFEPEALPGLRLAVDYTYIRKTDNIATLNQQQVVDNEAFLPGRVQRGPGPAGDPYGVGPITFLDVTTANISKASLNAYDVAVDYVKETADYGRFDTYLAATWETHYRTQFLPSQPFLENVGVGSTNPLKFKASGGLTWKHGPWTVGWNISYFDSYLVSTNAVQVLSQGGNGRVPGQVYHDFVLGYRFQAAGGKAGWRRDWVDGTEIQLGVRNVFDAKPPFDASNTQAYYSLFGDPRGASFYVSARHRF